MAASYPPPSGLFSLCAVCRARKRGRPATGGTLRARGQTRMLGAIAGVAGFRSAV